jgi:uncharacterized protein YjbI with pentapeptide repeats
MASGPKDPIAWLEAGEIREFNGWREAHPLATVDLPRSDLNHVDLRAANLSDADLREANLEGSDLRGATLTGAHLAGAKIKGARLAGVRYEYATMSRAQLDLIEEQNRLTVTLID